MMLDLKTTQYYLDCYGSDVSRWPEPEAGKIALAVYAADLGPALSSAQRLDTALAQATLPPPSDLLARRILSSLPAQHGAPANDVTPSPRSRLPEFRMPEIRLRALAAAMLVVGAAGFTVLSLQTPPTDNAAAESEVWREAALDMGVDDVFDWVYSEDG